MDRPYVVTHNVASIDGRTNGFELDKVLLEEVAERIEADAIVAGSDTMIARTEGAVDVSKTPVPTLDADADKPLLAVIDGRGRFRAWRQKLATGAYCAGVALLADSTPAAHVDYLDASNVPHFEQGDEHVDLAAALRHLHSAHGVERVRVDSGGVLNGVMLRLGLVDELSLLIHPALVGGVTGRSIIQTSEPTGAVPPIPARLESVETVAENAMWLRYCVQREA